MRGWRGPRTGSFAKLAAIAPEDLRRVIGDPAVRARLEADMLLLATIGLAGQRDQIAG